MSIEFDASALMGLGAELKRASAETQPKAEQVVAKSAYDLEAQGKANILAMDAVDTGDTLNTTSVDFISGLIAEVGPTTHYAVWVHDGTWKMPPRPFMTNALQTIEPSFIAAMEQLGGNIL